MKPLLNLMKKSNLIKLLLLIPICSQAFKIAVVDTGVPRVHDYRICENGEHNFTKHDKWDNHGHSSHVADVVHQHALGEIRTDGNLFPSTLTQATPYCFIFLKYWDAQMDGMETSVASENALDFLSRQEDVTMVLYAGGGYAHLSKEAAAVKRLLDKGVVFVAAAGNEGQDIDLRSYYPASYDSRIVSVGSVNSLPLEGFPHDQRTKYPPNRSIRSNYGFSVSRWEKGVSVLGRIGNQIHYMTGTSQAAAVAAGKILRSLLEVKDGSQ